ncbi:hypothetical protein H1Z61_12320 [Bacillus aquiflavi]|uniref:Uncharacterized protein n=1 Tax=Bacillus aquiflavi TaxID=2672567 RepID=A0A6B3VVS5_9BACI|nr:hypothetical protein [Bacillus aquiflavi]MBA4537893.1 hypothetical protein [Bacillus aquiflavi]NEY82149.1 hypothetical protein [Bacillus aquiflavi]UAC48409.1 hypothetical protein K6959_18275 [Bacillus aquiflavi]
MKHLLTCTNEELVLLVGLCGHARFTKMLIDGLTGEKSLKEWEAIVDTTVHQLMLKQIWDEERNKRNEIPLSDEMQKFIHSYVNSKWIIRCPNIEKQGVLIFHYIEESTWLLHLVDREILHEFAYVEQEEISKLIQDYYSFSDESLDANEQFRLTDEAFDLLSEKRNLKKVRKMSTFLEEEGTSFELFIDDLKKNEWFLNNISCLHIPSLEDDPLLTDIVFFLPSSKGVWVVKYTDDQTAPVLIQLKGLEQWHALLENVGHTASLINEEG